MQTDLYLKLVPLVLPLIKPKFDQLKNAVADATNVLLFEQKFKDYLERTLEKNSTISTIACRSKARPFYELYIPLTLLPHAPSEKPVYLDVFDSSFLVRNGKTLIVDKGGMGKSTCSKWFLLKAIEETKLIPVLIDLRRLTPEKSIVEYIQSELSPLGDSVDLDLIINLIGYGDFLFIFDGYDEIGSDVVKEVTRNLKDFIDRAARNYFIITSRPDLSISTFSNFSSYSIKPLTKEEAHTLIKNYDEVGIANRLIDELGKTGNKVIESFLGNPLLVSLLFAAYSFKQVIPFKKSIFFEQVFDALFELHDHTKGDFYRDRKSKLDKSQFQSVLSRIAFLSLIKYGKTEYTTTEFNKLVEESIKGSGFTAPVSGFITDLVKSVQLFSQDGIYYRWIHKSVQDYFAALFMRYEGKEKAGQIISKKIFPNIQSYSLMLELFYDLDPKVFRINCLKPILESYCKHVDNIKVQSIKMASAVEFYCQISFFSKAVIYRRESGNLDFEQSGKSIFREKILKDIFSEAEEAASKMLGRYHKCSYHPTEQAVWIRVENANYGALRLLKNIKIDIFSSLNCNVTDGQNLVQGVKYLIDAEKEAGAELNDGALSDIMGLYMAEGEPADSELLLDLMKVRQTIDKITQEIEDQSELDKLLDGL